MTTAVLRNEPASQERDRHHLPLVLAEAVAGRHIFAQFEPSI